MKKVILVFVVALFAVVYAKHDSMYYMWRTAVSSSPVIWNGVELVFPDGMMYDKDDDEIFFAWWKVADSSLSISKQDVSHAERTMKRFETYQDHMKISRGSVNYGGQKAEVLWLGMRNTPGERVMFAAFKEKGILATYIGPENSFSVFEPILSGLKFLD